MLIATPHSIMTCDEAIRCPSSWTPDQWINAINPIPGISYDELSVVQAWTVDGLIEETQLLGDAY
jgi:hypothetical protein